MDISRLVYVCERIGSYVALEKLKNSIKYIGSRDFSRVRINNAKLMDSVSKLRRLIYSNVIESLNESAFQNFSHLFMSTVSI